MISCHLNGGLGNQLFQIFATISYATQHGELFVFLKKDFYGNRNGYWDSFFKPLQLFTTEGLPDKMSFRREQHYHYNEIPPQKYQKQDIYLHGYYQSYRYFENNYEMICRLIRLEQQKKNLVKRYPNYISYRNMTSLHFRLGDYLSLSECHPVLSVEYYDKSIQKMMDLTENHKLHFLYFCQKEDNTSVQATVKLLQNKYPTCVFEKASDDASDWEQMLMMSCCRHHIIANSSFSWWGAYFNTSVDKIVCYPERWFGPKLLSQSTRDLCPNTWHNIVE
jgi:hypothetical protein|tara:strand:- start:4500 stop:5333 length:834 start_codon:yes stop_codon:yes gene_type:complete